jgi:hypothetical protein
VTTRSTACPIVSAAPKQPESQKAEPTSNPMIDKMIEKQLR